ncbi:MAG: glycogen synthase [Anaerolineales bacterium]|nr:glycogen synthase [Anaerolineales bacterium]
MPKTRLKVLFLAAEAEPFVKIGGLGDIAGSLPQALRALTLDERPKFSDIDARLIIPFHGAIQRQAYPLHNEAVFDIPYSSGPIQAEVLSTKVNGVPVYLICGAPIPRDAPVYSGDKLEDGNKFTFFSLAALEMAKVLNWQPNIIHANDWHTAIALYALKIQNDPFYKNASSILSLHNLPFLGEGTEKVLEKYDIPPLETPEMPTWARHMPLPLGLWSADSIVAVSPTYAQEILTPEFGSGLEDFLKTRQDAISGILNGINIDRWNPARDPALEANFTKDTLEIRQDNKLSLLKEFGFTPDPTIPLFAMVTRLDHQKGVDLLPETLQLLSDVPWRIIILGTGLPKIEKTIHELEDIYPNRVRMAIRFDDQLSRRIYAGADMLLIPSRYEPCGLTQMFAMRYGCVPIARATGGLKDTIADSDPGKCDTGFLFKQANSSDLANAVRRALLVFNDRETWRVIQRNGMAQDFSWERSAKQYAQLYFSLYDRKRVTIITP